MGGIVSKSNNKTQITINNDDNVINTKNNMLLDNNTINNLNNSNNQNNHNNSIKNTNYIKENDEDTNNYIYQYINNYLHENYLKYTFDEIVDMYINEIAKIYCDNSIVETTEINNANEINNTNEINNNNNNNNKYKYLQMNKLNISNMQNVRTLNDILLFITKHNKQYLNSLDNDNIEFKILYYKITEINKPEKEYIYTSCVINDEILECNLDIIGVLFANYFDKNVIVTHDVIKNDDSYLTEHIITYKNFKSVECKKFISMARERINLVMLNIKNFNIAHENIILEKLNKSKKKLNLENTALIEKFIDDPHNLLTMICIDKNSKNIYGIENKIRMTINKINICMMQNTENIQNVYKLFLNLTSDIQ